MSSAVAAPLPWGRAQKLTVIALNSVGALMIGVAWSWAAGCSEAQTAPLNLAVLAMIVTGASNGLWLMRGRRAIGARRRAWLADLRGDAPTTVAPRSSARTTQAVDHTDDGAVLVVRTAGATRFHRAGCALVADRPTRSMGRNSASSEGKSPCGACCA